MNGACPGGGSIGNLNPDGGNFLSVRAAPSSSAKEKDRVGPDQAVWICEETSGWYGVVYQKNGDGANCGLGYSESRKPYAGSCSSGWISSRFVVGLAG